MKRFILLAILLMFLLSASTPLFSHRSIKMKAGESILIHCDASILSVEPLPAHRKKEEIHSDWLLSCEWGLD